MAERVENSGLMAAPSTDDVLARLEILWRKLEGDGWYVNANTVALAIDEIRRLRK